MYTMYYFSMLIYFIYMYMYMYMHKLAYILCLQQEYQCPNVRAQLQLKSKHDDFTSQDVVVNNSTAAFTFNKTEVGDNCCFNGSITTKNEAGSRSSNNTSICK